LPTDDRISSFSGRNRPSFQSPGNKGFGWRVAQERLI
jgi:hypothetical protein